MRPERVYFLNLYNVGLWFMFHWSLNNKNTGFGLSIYFLEMKTSLEFLEIFCNTFLNCLRGLFSAKWLALNFGMKSVLNHLGTCLFPFLINFSFPVMKTGFSFQKFLMSSFETAFHYQLNTLISCDNQFLDFGFTFNLTVPIFFAYHFNKKQCVYHAPK